jgi:hypothetical protein
MTFETLIAGLILTIPPADVRNGVSTSECFEVPSGTGVIQKVIQRCSLHIDPIAYLHLLFSSKSLF